MCGVCVWERERECVCERERERERGREGEREGESNSDARVMNRESAGRTSLLQARVLVSQGNTL